MFPGQYLTALLVTLVMQVITPPQSIPDIVKEIDSAEEGSNEHLLLGRELIKTAFEQKDTEALIKGIMTVSQYWKANDDLNNSIAFINESLEEYNELIPDRSKAELLDELSRLFYKNGELVNSLEALNEGLNIREGLNDSGEILKSYRNLGIYYGRQKKDSAALQYFKKSLDLSLEINDTLSVIQSYANLGVTYVNLDQLNIALKYFMQNLRFKHLFKSTSQKSLSNSYHNLGWVYENLGNYDSSIVHYQSAIGIREEIGFGSGLADTYNNLGYLHYRMGNNDEAISNYYKSLGLAERLNKRRLLRKLYSNLSRIHKESGRFENAYRFLYKYDTLNQELFDEAKNRQIEELKTAYETEKKDQELQLSQLLLREQKTLNNYFTILLTAVAAVSLLIILFYQQRQKTLRQLRLRAHDEFELKMNKIIREGEVNTLNAMIEGQEKERIRIAEDLHDQVGSMLSGLKLLLSSAHGNSARSVIQKAENMLNKTIDETRLIAHNLATGVLVRFGLVSALNDLKHSIEQSGLVQVDVDVYGLDNRLPSDLEIAIYRVLQELFSNVLKHANAKHISVQLSKHDDNSLTILLEDDGIGFSEGTAGQGIGLKNVRNRVRKFDGELSIDSVVGRGTTVLIKFINI